VAIITTSNLEELPRDLGHDRRHDARVGGRRCQRRRSSSIAAGRSTRPRRSRRRPAPTGRRARTSSPSMTSGRRTALVVKTDNGDDGTYETTWTITPTSSSSRPTGCATGRPGRTTGSSPWVASGSRPETVARRAGHRRWGWTAVPAAVTEATLILAAKIWKRKNSPEGVLGGWSEYGAVRCSATRTPKLCPSAAPFVVPGRAGNWLADGNHWRCRHRCCRPRSARPPASGRTTTSPKT